MKKENENLSRRTFLSKGAGVAAAAGASIIAIPALAAPGAENAENAANTAATFATVTTDGVQTLTNKTIPSWQNILGTDSLNVKEYLSSGTNITSALNSAISAMGSYGGVILIPHGVWTTDGGHNLTSGITIQGVGVNSNGYTGTEVKLNASQSSYVFRVTTNHQNVALKDLSVNLVNNSNASGLVLTNYNGGDPVGTNIYFTSVKNVHFNAGAYGIKVDSKETNNVSTNFECILNRFEKVSFIGCATSFFCNSVNGGYEFDTCYFSLPSSGTALHLKWIGNLTAENCLFVGNQANDPWEPASDGTTVLKTYGAYNNIAFYNCQDENVQYMYQNSTNDYDYVPLVFRNCLIQSKFKYTAHGSVILEACRMGTVDGVFEDSSTKRVLIYLKGTNNIYTQYAETGGPLGTLVNAYSQVIYEAQEINLPSIQTSALNSYTINNTTRGIVLIPSGTAYTIVYNHNVTSNSLILAQLRTYDSGGAKIREVQCNAGYFQINLTANAASNLSVGFIIEG